MKGAWIRRVMGLADNTDYTDFEIADCAELKRIFVDSFAAGQMS
jgi:hypothetical protein